MDTKCTIRQLRRGYLALNLSLLFSCFLLRFDNPCAILSSAWDNQSAVPMSSSTSLLLRCSPDSRAKDAQISTSGTTKLDAIDDNFSLFYGAGCLRFVISHELMGSMQLNVALDPRIGGVKSAV